MSEEPRPPLEPELITQPAADHLRMEWGNAVGGAAPPYPRYAAPRRPPRRKLALVLFLLTCASTFYAGGTEFGKEYVTNPQTGWVESRPVVSKFIQNGLIYSVGVLAILGFHEMGHYLQARRYKVPASFPYFIPMPFGPFGTMGAVIVQQAGVADRKSLFDIAISGPLAGLVLAIPMTYFGLLQSQIIDFADLPRNEPQRFLGVPLLVQWMMTFFVGPLPRNQVLDFSPLLFAGWVGIFITALNLIPIGQLDGGHILYCLLRRKAHVVARLIFVAAVTIVALTTLTGNGVYASWTLMLMLLWMMGTRHPPTADDNAPLGPGRTLLGWLTLMFIVIGFTPTPIVEFELRAAPQPPPVQRNVEREILI